MVDTNKNRKRKPRAKTSPSGSSHVIWPPGVQKLFDISAVTRWRWEKSGRLPARDVNVGGKTGWKPETLGISN